MNTRYVLLAATTIAVLAGCGDSSEPAAGTAPPAVDAAPAAGLATVTPTVAAGTIADPPPGLVILDVRTPEEFAEGHIDGAVMLDFYDPAFADGLAALDPTVPYVVYCRSGNRSGQTMSMMAELGFRSAEDIGGGIVAWQDAGLPVTSG